MGLPTCGTGVTALRTPRLGQGAAHFSDPPINPPTEHPPFIQVDLTGGESRRETADPPVDTVTPVLRRIPRRLVMPAQVA